MGIEQFIGTWELVSMEEKLKGKVVEKPYGDSPLGFITYTEKGFMHAILMKRDRDSVGISIEELSSIKKPWVFFSGFRYLKGAINYFKASASFASYSGKFEVNDKEVIHHVESSFFPDWIGADLIREYEFFDNRMILSAKNYEGTIIDLTWEKRG